MKNILRIFKSDIGRISKNVVALIVITGLSIIPCLYAWFNILSNWDPYSSSSTSNLNIAVFSEDKGETFLDFSVNVGDKLIAELHANDDIGWVFPESKELTMEGIYSGKYYAALLIPEDFTTNLMSFVNGDPQSPVIQYFGNDKKNAVATKITSKVKTTIQRKINETFLETITLYSSEVAESTLGNKEFTEQIIDTTVSTLETMDKKLETYLSVIDSIILINDSASGLLQTADAVIPEMGGIISAGSDAVEIMQSSTNAGNNTAAAVIQMADASLSAMISSMDAMYSQAGLVSSGVDVSTITGTLDQITESRAFHVVKTLIDAAGETALDLTTAYQNAKDSFDNLVTKIEVIAEASQNAKAEAENLKAALEGDISQCKASLEDLKYQFDNTVAPKLTGVIDEASAALSNAATLLGEADTDFSELAKTLEDYESTLGEGTSALNDTKTYVEETREDLDALKQKLAGLNSTEAFQQLLSMLDDDSVSLADFIASPVTVNDVVFYNIDNFGSEMAPFYTILGIWAGSLIMIALVKVKVVEDEENRNMKAWQKFFGRYLLFFLIGQVQALITVLGDLFFLGIYCVHPVLFVLTGMIASFVFTLLMYSLTVAFRAVGQAIVVVILVIQVAGAGGTFPIEVLPEAYKAAYRFLPFNYAINGMRECVGGIYGNDFLIDIGKLLIFAGVAVIIGLVMMKPFAKLRLMVDKSKEESGVML